MLVGGDFRLQLIGFVIRSATRMSISQPLPQLGFLVLILVTYRSRSNALPLSCRSFRLSRRLERRDLLVARDGPGQLYSGEIVLEFLLVSGQAISVFDQIMALRNRVSDGAREEPIDRECRCIDRPDTDHPGSGRRDSMLVTPQA